MPKCLSWHPWTKLAMPTIRFLKLQNSLIQTTQGFQALRLNLPTGAWQNNDFGKTDCPLCPFIFRGLRSTIDPNWESFNQGPYAVLHSEVNSAIQASKMCPWSIGREHKRSPKMSNLASTLGAACRRASRRRLPTSCRFNWDVAFSPRISPLKRNGIPDVNICQICDSTWNRSKWKETTRVLLCACCVVFSGKLCCWWRGMPLCCAWLQLERWPNHPFPESFAAWPWRYLIHSDSIVYNTSNHICIYALWMIPNQSQLQQALQAPFAQEATNDPACPQAAESKGSLSQWYPWYQPTVAMAQTTNHTTSHRRHTLSLMWLLMIPLDEMFLSRFWKQLVHEVMYIETFTLPKNLLFSKIQFLCCFLDLEAISNEFCCPIFVWGFVVHHGAYIFLSEVFLSRNWLPWS